MENAEKMPDFKDKKMKERKRKNQYTILLANIVKQKIKLMTKEEYIAMMNAKDFLILKIINVNEQNVKR